MTLSRLQSIHIFGPMGRVGRVPVDRSILILSAQFISIAVTIRLATLRRAGKASGAALVHCTNPLFPIGTRASTVMGRAAPYRRTWALDWAAVAACLRYLRGWPRSAY